MKKGFSELFGLLKTYSKKSFKIVYEDKFMELLKPFSDLLEINMKLSLFELKYTNKDDLYVNDFKKVAIVQRYCDCLEKVMDILRNYHGKPILYKIKVGNIFKKTAYENLSKV